MEINLSSKRENWKDLFREAFLATYRKKKKGSLVAKVHFLYSMESSSVCVHLQCCQIQNGIEGKQSLNRCWYKLEASKGLAFCCQEDRCRCTFWHCKLKWPKFSFFRKVKIYSLLGSRAVWPAWKHSSLRNSPLSWNIQTKTKQVFDF